MSSSSKGKEGGRVGEWGGQVGEWEGERRKEENNTACCVKLTFFVNECTYLIYLYMM